MVFLSHLKIHSILHKTILEGNNFTKKLDLNVPLPPYRSGVGGVRVLDGAKKLIHRTVSQLSGSLYKKNTR